MKKISVLVAAIFTITVSVAAMAADHGHGTHAGGSHDMRAMGGPAHEEVVEGVKATFMIQTMADAMKDMGVAMPAGVKESHHVSVIFKDAKSGKPLTEGVVKVKILAPNKSEQTKDMMGMQGHFGTDVEMAKKGKYGVMSRFQLKDGKVRSSKFWYTVK